MIPISNSTTIAPSLYPASMTAPMQAELENAGVKPLHTAAEVDEIFSKKEEETIFLVVNSVCGCAAGNARPAVALAMNHSKLPQQNVTVFAGVDQAATKRAREFVNEIPPSSPSMFLFKNGKCVFSLERHQIQGRAPEELARELTKAFDAFC
jgi:putative YphP/YqiW family bacilliredoxin